MAAIICSLAWMELVLRTGLHIGYLSVAVGVIVGFAVRSFGRGTHAIYGAMAAVLTLLSCLSGDIFAAVQLATTPTHDFFDVLQTIDLYQLVLNIVDAMPPLIYGCYAVGLIAAYFLSFGTRVD